MHVHTCTHIKGWLSLWMYIYSNNQEITFNKQVKYKEITKNHLEPKLLMKLSIKINCTNFSPFISYIRLIIF